MDEERSKKPLALVGLMKKNETGLHLYLYRIAGIYHVPKISCLIYHNRYLHIICIFHFIAYSCSQHSHNPFSYIVEIKVL